MIYACLLKRVLPFFIVVFLLWESPSLHLRENSGGTDSIPCQNPWPAKFWLLHIPVINVYGEIICHGIFIGITRKKEESSQGLPNSCALGLNLFVAIFIHYWEKPVWNKDNEGDVREGRRGGTQSPKGLTCASEWINMTFQSRRWIFLSLHFHVHCAFFNGLFIFFIVVVIELDEFLIYFG